jgi:hypothetical protein
MTSPENVEANGYINGTILIHDYLTSSSLTCNTRFMWSQPVPEGRSNIAIPPMHIQAEELKSALPIAASTIKPLRT